MSAIQTILIAGVSSLIHTYSISCKFLSFLKVVLKMREQVGESSEHPSNIPDW